MQPLVEEEYSRVGAVVRYNNSDQSSDEDISSEWQFISRSIKEESDDDSVEIIDCETSSSMTSSSGTFSSDSEPEEDYEGVNFTDFNNPVEEMVSDQEKAIIPVNYVKAENYEIGKGVVASGSSYKMFYAFFIGILASLVFQNFKNCFPDHFLDVLYSSKSYATDTFSSFPFPRTNVEHLSSPEYSNERADDDDLLTRLKDQILKRRADVDQTFERQLNLLKYIKPSEKDTYVLNFGDVMQQPTQDMRINQLVAKTPLRMCTDNVTRQEMPIMCRDIENNDVVLFLRSDDIISIHDVVQKFLSDTEKKAQNSLEEILNVVTMSTLIDENNGFSSDHDSAGAELDDVRSHDQPELEHLNKMPYQSVFEVPSPFADKEEAENVKVDSSEDRESERVVNIETDASIKKEWSDSLFPPFKDLESRKKVNEGTENLDKMKKWLNNLGDWFLKQGEARERLRQARDMILETEYKRSRNNKNYKDKKSFRQWFTKTSEKLRGKLKSSFMKVKDRVKKMKGKVADIVKDLKAKLKDRFQKF